MGLFCGERWPKMETFSLGNDKIIEGVIYLMGLGCVILVIGLV